MGRMLLGLFGPSGGRHFLATWVSWTGVANLCPRSCGPPAAILMIDWGAVQGMSNELADAVGGDFPGVGIGVAGGQLDDFGDVVLAQS